MLFLQLPVDFLAGVILEEGQAGDVDSSGEDLVSGHCGRPLAGLLSCV